MASRPVAPKDIVTASLRLLEAPNPDYAATKILGDLAGHGYELVHRPPGPQRCSIHTGTTLQGGICPSCGPQGL
jgi:hypothetical protein